MKSTPFCCCTGNCYYFIHLCALLQAVAGLPGPKGEKVCPCCHDCNSTCQESLVLSPFASFWVLSWHHCERCRVFLVWRCQARSGREACLEKRWVGPEPLAHVLIFLSYLVTPAASQGTRGDRGAPGNKGERVSTAPASYITLSERHRDNLPSVFTLGRGWRIWGPWGRCKQPPLFRCLADLCMLLKVRWWDTKWSDQKNQKKWSSWWTITFKKFLVCASRYRLKKSIEP